MITQRSRRATMGKQEETAETRTSMRDTNKQQVSKTKHADIENNQEGHKKKTTRTQRESKNTLEEHKHNTRRNQ